MITTTTTIRLTEEQQAALDQAEADYGLNQSLLIRKAIDIVYVWKMVGLGDAFKTQQEQASA